jgi:hypothetical protein
MPRPCSICCDSAKIKIAAEMVAAGAKDQAVADALGGGLNRMAVARHRVNHIVGPAKALAEAAAKGRDATEQRAQVMAAAEAGDPSAFVALASIVEDLRKVHARLERSAKGAEDDNQRLAVASLSAQQLRAYEVRAKLGGVGGYAAQKAPGMGEAGAFVVNFMFSGGQVQTLSATVVDAEPEAGRAREGGEGRQLMPILPSPAGDEADPGDDLLDDLLGPLPPGLAQLAAASRGRPVGWALGIRARRESR